MFEFFYRKEYQDKLIKEIDELFEKLFPICRSITGNGVRKTLSEIKKITDFNIEEIPSGTKCYDWQIPDEWNIDDAYIENLDGEKIIDFKKNNLHVMNYSIPINKIMDYDELKSHLHTLSHFPDAIPYRTTYYDRGWGFCLSENDLKKFNFSKKYHVVIDSKLSNGSLSIGECSLSGIDKREYLFWTYCCHPSLANDNLSGIILWILLLRELKKIKTKNNYRFVIGPETIGAIAYLFKNEIAVKKINGGFIITNVAGPDQISFKKTFSENSEIDLIVDEIFKEMSIPRKYYPFDINGSDERQFSSPFFRIPMGTVCKSKYYEYENYHTSKDDLNFVSSKNLLETMKVYLRIIEKLEENQFYYSLNPKAEPMLSKRGLYPSKGGTIKQKAFDFTKEHQRREYQDKISNIKGIDLDAIRWIMFYADGQNSLLDISKKTNIEYSKILDSAKILEELGLIGKDMV